MSHKTLKEAYAAKKIALLEHRATSNVDEIIAKNVAARVICEAIDPQDLKATSDMIKRLRDVVSSTALKSIGAAVQNAQDDLNKASEGTISSKIWGKLKSLGYKNPYLKALTLANALETGFSQLPAILANNNVNVETDGNTPLNKLLNIDRLNSIKKQIVNSFVPSGTFAVFKTIPYVDTSRFADEIVTIPLNSIMDVSEKTSQTVNAVDQASADIVAAAKEDTSSEKTEQPKEEQKPAQKQSSVSKADLEDRINFYKQKGFDGTKLITKILNDYGMKVESKIVASKK